jgi:hypothetical protein
MLELGAKTDTVRELLQDVAAQVVFRRHVLFGAKEIPLQPTNDSDAASTTSHCRTRRWSR